MKTRVPITDSVYYALQTMLAFTLAMLATKYLLILIGNMDGNMLLGRGGLYVPVVIFGQYIVPALFQLIFLSRKPSEHYTEGGKFLWIKSGLKYILPGEAFRLLVCIFPAPITLFGRLFSWSGMLLFTDTYYGLPQCHDRLVRTFSASDMIDMFDAIGRGDLVFGDILAYIGCHILMLIPYIVILLILYRVFWNRRKKEITNLKSKQQYH